MFLFFVRMKNNRLSIFSLPPTFLSRALSRHKGGRKRGRPFQFQRARTPSPSQYYLPRRKKEVPPSKKKFSPQKLTGAPSSPGGERSLTRDTNSCFPPLSDGSSTRPMSLTLMPACSRRLPGGGVTRIWVSDGVLLGEKRREERERGERARRRTRKKEKKPSR